MTIESNIVGENAETAFVLGLNYCPDCLNFKIFDRLDSATGEIINQKCLCADDSQILIPGKLTRSESRFYKGDDFANCQDFETRLNDCVPDEDFHDWDDYIPDNEFYEITTKNTVKLTRKEIIAEVERTGVLRAHHLSAAAVDVIYSLYQKDINESDVDNFLKDASSKAYLKFVLENSEKYPKDDLKIINLVYERPIETLQVSDGYLDLFAEHQILHRRENFSDTFRGDLNSLDNYVHNNIEVVTAVHDKQHLNPEALTEADRSEIYIASQSCYRFHYEGDLRTVSCIEGNPHELHFIRTLTLKRPKPVYQKMVRDSIGKLDVTHFSKRGTKIIRQIAEQNQCDRCDEFLKIQSSNLHLLERKFFRCLREATLAEEIKFLKKDLEIIQAFKEASADVDQIILPKAEILIFADGSVLFAPEGEEPESHVDIYQFIMARLKYIQGVYFPRERHGWEPGPSSLSSQLRRLGIAFDFDFAQRRVITKFTQEFKKQLFNAANIQIVEAFEDQG